MPDTLQQIILQLQKEGKIPRDLSPAQLKALARSISRYSEFISEDGIKKVVQKLQTGIQDVMNPRQVGGVTTGKTEGSLRGELSNLINKFSTAEGLGQAINLDFIIHTATAIMSGAGHYIADTTPQQVALYPAWALSRFADRDTPRGFKRGKKGELIPVPDDDWPARWQAAGDDAGDEDWLPWEGDAETGRGVALKSSSIWQALGDGAGGYEDTLGNASDPIAFNTGFRRGPVSRAETIELGLIDPKDEVDPPEFDLENLIHIPMQKAA